MDPLTLCVLLLDFGEFVSDALVSFDAYLNGALKEKVVFASMEIL